MVTFSAGSFVLLILASMNLVFGKSFHYSRKDAFTEGLEKGSPHPLTLPSPQGRGAKIGLLGRPKILYTASMPPTHIPTYEVPPNPSAPGTDEWKYNEIMRHIHPDLITTVLPTLAEKYAKETQEERDKRVDAYNEAFAIFDQAAAVIGNAGNAALRQIRQEAHAEAAKREKVEKNNDEQQAEHLLDDATSA